MAFNIARPIAQFHGRSLVNGSASAELLYSSASLSFWGGVNPQTGDVVDHHHPLRGKCMASRILAIPCGRGSCTGSTVMLELLLNECAPAGLIFEQPEEIVTLGVLVGKVLFQRSLPVIVLASEDFHRIKDWPFAAIDAGRVQLSGSLLAAPPLQLNSLASQVELSQSDQSILAGAKGTAAKVALQTILHFAAIQEATCLIDVSRAHIDACIYTGPASLKFAQSFQAMGARFALPTTLNSISIDQRRWKELGVDPELAEQAGTLANIYLSMGAQPSFTCAPYNLDSAPKEGENIGWAESNAVAFANSVLGAHTQKYPDFIDVCIALTGRAPSAGCHTVEGRRPGICIQVHSIPDSVDDAFYPALGYAVGKIAQHRIPLVCGIDHLNPQRMDLKSFSAAFATTSSAAMFHINGVTPESARFASLEARLPHFQITAPDILECRRGLNSAPDPSVGLVSLGNPHFAMEEFESLSRLCARRTKSPSVELIITTSRSTYELAFTAGIITTLEDFGAVIITDTCWCMLGEPVVPKSGSNIMTNSGKYAHYAPGMVHRGVHFGSLAQCVNAACTGKFLDILDATDEKQY
ncbi:hypothetical protein P170DRAFT_439534 [Aspergillus steynii IBT 23096]|uniref:DUF521 domain protein n=1 Tax=Aspergillus steynii IBT 23096 TaxID=1392250 RepID=A0A2I2FYX4_9EURO|nr:uncharacterized protein P170DRAFT_439534 [Aspergillus steynii IBT 23096]PLB45825.1 hypothetical protein P170DRAFT_439534 [Aspergillus steynii IBT 23096]